MRQRCRPGLRRARTMSLLLVGLFSVLLHGTLVHADDEPLAFSFSQDLYQAEIYENHGAKEYVRSEEKMGVGIPAVDSGKSVRFKIVGGDDDNYFKAEKLVVGDFCFLLLRTRTGRGDVLNRERQAEFRLKVRVFTRRSRRVRGNRRDRVFAEVHIRILDRNDLNPWFESPSYDVHVAEDLTLHGTVLRLHADDADEGVNGQIYYSLQEVDEHFAVHPTSGEVTLLRRLNHRQTAEFRLIAVARDRGPKRINGHGLAQLRISVTPVNLHDPVMQVTHMPEVVENSNMDVYAIVRVTDADEGVHGQVGDVRVTGGNPHRRFRIKPGASSGEFLVGVVGHLDRESAPFGYNLTLNATDRGVPQRWSSRTVEVRLMDFNDHSPMFAREVYMTSVREKALPQTAVIQLRASDTDWGVNAELRYAIAAGNEDNVFTVNPRTGLLSTAKSLDAETLSSYTLTVSALDQGLRGSHRQGSTRVTVTVLDDNDNPPLFVTPNSQAFVEENEPADFYVTRVTATDLDQGENGFLSFSLANSDPIPFEINSFDGTIQTTEVLDFETQRRQYVLHVRVSDWGKPYRWQAETTVTVHLRNVNDNRPQFEKVACRGRVSRYVPPLTELMVLSAIDLDQAAKVGYRIVSGNDDGCFRLDERLGSLSVMCDLSEDTGVSERKIGVMANDGEHFSDEMMISLQLVGDSAALGNSFVSMSCEETDVADKYRKVLSASEMNNRDGEQYTVPTHFTTNYHIPEIRNANDDLIISEAAAIGTHVMNINARDLDLGFSGSLVYAISNGDPDSAFRVDLTGGNISVVGALDREKRARYDLNVTVCDLGLPQKCSNRKFTVRILDVNDNSPRFVKPYLVFYFSESRESGQSVVQLNAADPDEGVNGEVTYQLVTDTKDFTVDATTGILTQVVPLDRERQASYELVVAARDSGISVVLQSLATVHVEVLDVNDNAPVFSRLVYRCSVAEDQPVGAVVTAVDARDPDRAGMLEPVTYRLTSGGQQHFSVDRNTGAVRLRQALDYEHRQIYNLTVVATDRDSPQLSATAHVIVKVVDVNENYHRPTFHASVVSGVVAENLAPGTFVMSVVATDADPPGPDSEISYSILGGDGMGHFTINETGIYTREVLDRETRASYWLTVFATDSGAVPLRSKLQVYVAVEDDNDNRPQSSQAVYRAQVAENGPAGVPVVQVAASDRDGDGPLYFQLAHADPPLHFKIHPTTGLISTTENSLDREVQESYVLKVTVTDWGRPALTSTVQVKVAVTDENDSTPRFLERHYKPTVPWGPATINTHTPLFQVLASDADVGDNGEVVYSISGAASLACRIDPHSGHVYLKTTDNLVPGSKHQLQIRAADGGLPSLTSTVPVLVTLMADDLTPSVYPPAIHLSQSSVVLYERYGVGQLVIMASANDTVVFTAAAGNDGGVFSVSGQGAIILAKPLDRETQAAYRLNISASDGHHTVHSALEVSVQDANDCDPRFDRDLYEVSVSELTAPGTEVVALRAFDADFDSILHYSLEGAENSQSERLFLLNDVTGQLTLLTSLDREVTRRHLLTVSVSDRGSPPRQDSARVLVHVLDENDHAPSFQSQLLIGRVHETAAAGSHVITVQAIDRDHGVNGRLTYSIVSGNSGNAFTVDPDLGTVLVANRLDQARVAEYMLTVRATDGGQPPRHEQVHVNVLVTLPDNLPPRFKQREYSVQVREDVAVGSLVLSVEAEYRGSLTYRLRTGNQQGVFLLNPGSGALTVSQPLDFEQRSVYNLTVQAFSATGISSVVHAVVDVMDVNDNGPVLSRREYRGQVREDAAAGSPVLTPEGHQLVVTASDADSYKNGQLHFSIVEAAARELVDVDAASGAVTTRGRLDYEQLPELLFSVLVQDGGSPRQQAVARLRLQLLDVNDEAPRFAHAQFNLTVVTPSYGGVRIGRVHGSDPDSDDITYSLSGRDAGMFSVDPASGVLRVAAAESAAATGPLQLPALSNVTVRAWDGLHGTQAVVLVTSARLEPAAAGDGEQLRFARQRYLAAVTEGSSGPEVVTALDVQGNRLDEHLTFSILNPSQYFTIGSTAGVVRTAGVALDRELRASHVLAVQVRGDRVGRTAQALLEVSVLDVNDNAPVFVSLPYHAMVAAEAPADTIVFRVSAVDADADNNGRVRYRLEQGNTELFRIEPDTGLIRLLRSPRGLDTAHRLVVMSQDGGRPQLSASAEVHVSTVHGSQPRFSQAHYWGPVAESASHGTPVLTLQATAPAATDQLLLSPTAAAADSRRATGLVFQLTEPRHNRLFDVDFETGVLYVSGALDFESRQLHALVVSATDRVTGASSSVPVTLHVTDVNDNRPSFSQQHYRLSVSEQAHTGTELLNLTATDRDHGQRLSFSVRGRDGADSRWFSVLEGGRLVVSELLDREQVEVHHLQLVVTDNGTPALNATAALTVTVEDVNDNSPEFGLSSYMCEVTDSPSRGQFVTMVTASDPDVSDTVVYHIVDGNDRQLFSVHQQTGIISVLSLIRFGADSPYKLNISASDGIHRSYVTATIRLIPTNQHAPLFERVMYEVELSESAPAGSAVTQVTAHDPDGGHLGQVTYSIPSHHWSKWFNINATSGLMTTLSPLDRETAGQLEVPVSATDGGNRCGHVTVRVRLLDVNDSPPQFDVRQYRVTLPADLMAGDVICQVTASDKDEGRNAVIEYSIYPRENAAVGQSFAISPDKGELILMRPPEQLESRVYQFFVRATDGGSQPLVADVPVEVLVLTEGETAPMFEAPDHRPPGVFLSESAEVGTRITSVRAVMGAGAVRYSVVSSHQLPLPDMFEVDDDGQLLLAKPLDREISDRYNVTVAAESDSLPPLVSHRRVSLLITDVNDNPPLFDTPLYEASIRENLAAGARIVQVLALDADLGSSGKVRYSLHGDSNGLRSVLAVDESSGWISTLTPLDREQQQQYQISVVATDAGSLQLSATSTVLISVSDDNDSAPRFLQSRYVTAVNEDAALQTPIITLETRDDDQHSQQLSFHITDGDADDNFQVVTTGVGSAELLVNAALDRESVDKYQLIITATDGRLVASTSVRVDVLDTNDNPPVCGTVEYRHTLSEDSAPQFLFTALASDADQDRNARMRFSLSGLGADDFTIDPDLGHVQVSVGLDRETRAVYVLKVHVQDVARPDWECTSQLMVTLTDVNDSPPRFPQHTVSLTVPEDTAVGTILARLHADDPDIGVSAEVEYSLENLQDDHLLLDPVTGIVTLGRPLDRELTAMYNISVRATDRGTPRLSTTAVVLLLVQDVNDNPPEFTRTMYHTSAPENISVGHELLKLAATSRDSGINAVVSYSIVGGNEHNMFRINDKTGMVWVAGELDFERAGEYVLVVEARDGGSPALTNHATVNITVLDCNDNAPIFSQSSYSAVVAEDASAGHQVLQVGAADLDSVLNGRLHYAITDGDEHARFHVHPDTGQILVAGQLDRETMTNYLLEVMATDSGEPKLSSRTVVSVHITDINDNPPLFTETTYSAIVQEDREVGHQLLQLSVRDADAPPNAGPFVFSIVEGNVGSAFLVDADGRLRTASRFNHRVRSLYTLRVQVTDAGQPPQTSHTSVNVKIIEEPQYPPVSVPLHVTVLAPTDGLQGWLVGRIHASDQDPYDQLHFSLDPEQLQLFELDAEDGSLTALAGLDPGQYRLNVSVTDGRFTTATQALVDVRLISDDMAAGAVVLTLAGVTPRLFITGHLKAFRRAMHKYLRVRAKDVQVLSVQAVGGKRVRRQTTAGGVDVLFAARRGDAWLPAEQLRRRLRSSRGPLGQLLGLQVLSVNEDRCQSGPCQHGDCTDEVVFDPHLSVNVASDVVSFVAPQYSLQLSCRCHVGFGGSFCDRLVNECGLGPCPDYQQCVPSGGAESGDAGPGYSCRCPAGRTGARCQLVAAQCSPGQCYEPRRPVSLTGAGLLEFTLLRPSDRRFVVSLSLRTRQPTGTLLHAHGAVDHHTLELENGLLQYRFDCGGGEIRVLVAHVRLNDDRWHNVLVKRFDNRAELLVDGTHAAQGVSPGDFAVLTVESGLLYVGGRPDFADVLAGAVWRGFTGCLDNLELDGTALPLQSAEVSPIVLLQRSVGLRLGCDETLPIPGVCGRHPCQNGGRCIEQPGLQQRLDDQGFVCACAPRFAGARCELDSDRCASSPCLNGGECRNGDAGDFQCRCRAGLSGARCQHGLHCGGGRSPCLNGGRCEEAGRAGPVCRCLGFTGRLCERDVDECRQAPCLHGSTCLNVPGSYRCLCAANWTGAHCGRPVDPPGAPADTAAGARTPVLLEQALGAGVCLLVALLLVSVLVAVCWRQARRKRSRTPHGAAASSSRRDPTASNQILLQNIKPKNQQVELQRMSKVSNLEANGVTTTTLRSTARPVSYSGCMASAARCEPPCTALNNLDTIRNYGSAADQLDAPPAHPPHIHCQYLQNFNKPMASVAPSVASGAAAASAADPANSTLEKAYREIDKNARPSFYDQHKILNDSLDPQLAALNRVQLPIMDKSPRDVRRRIASPGGIASPSLELPGYHWDCSDWAATACQSPLPNITEVTATEIKDTASFHSNESNESHSAARLNALAGLRPLDGDDDVLETLDEDRTSDYAVADDSSDDEQLHTLPDPTADFDCILRANGVLLSDGSTSELSSLGVTGRGGQPPCYSRSLPPQHPNSYLPLHCGVDTDDIESPLTRYRYPVRRRPLRLGTYSELESLTASATSDVEDADDAGSWCPGASPASSSCYLNQSNQRDRRRLPVETDRLCDIDCSSDDGSTRV